MIEQIATYFAQHGGDWLEMLGQHLAVSGISLAIATLIALPLGALCARTALAERIATGAASVLRVVPSLAVLILCVPYLGVGALPAVVSLAALAVPPMLINTVSALRARPGLLSAQPVRTGLPSARAPVWQPPLPAWSQALFPLRARRARRNTRRQTPRARA